MIILDPDHIPRSDEPIDDLCEPHVSLPVSQPILLGKVHIPSVVVEQGPQDRVGEPVVMTICELVREVDGVTVEFGEEVRVYLVPVFYGDLRVETVRCYS
jgi:hypothetical protein